MPTKSESPSEAGPVAAAGRDAELVAFVRSVVDAVGREHGAGVVTEPDLKFNPLLLYTETHYALSALLLFCLDGRDARWLETAAARLRLCGTTTPATFFNAMAVCLMKIVFDRAEAAHAGLEAALDDFLARTVEHRDAAYQQWCGNNAYLQQVTVDTVLLPLARGREPSEADLALLAGEFRKFLSPEGFFFDLPRIEIGQEQLFPPTYVMKMLFLAGVCDAFAPGREFGSHFRAGMAATLPLLTNEGDFSYFGRTDNSPFAAGLTIFNLRKAAEASTTAAAQYARAGAAAEWRYRTYPRTASGRLQSNRFKDPQSETELLRSRDEYAFTGQYSLASCAYALLGCYWFPTGNPGPGADTSPKVQLAVATSHDLGLVKVSGARHELILRTASQMTASDRRYLGPTVLRYALGGDLLVGAIPQTVSTDLAVAPGSPTGLAGLHRLFRYRFDHGVEQLDGVSVGYLPVVRHGATDYIPYGDGAVTASTTHVRMRYRMLRLKARHHYAVLIEARDYLRKNLPGLEPPRFVQPWMQPDDSLELIRDIHVSERACRIEDRISGDLAGKTVVFSTRYCPAASVRVSGLAPRTTLTCWGSDGRQAIDVYESPRLRQAELHYICEIAAR